MAHADLKFFGFFGKKVQLLGMYTGLTCKCSASLGGSGFERLRLAVYPKPQSPKPSMYVSP